MSQETLHPASIELETQLRRLETIVDPASRTTAADLVAAVLRFHTAALEQMLEVIRGSSENESVLKAFDRDPLIRSMLLVHDLHPDPLEVRLQRAMAEVESMLQKRGAVVELLEADADGVRVRISGGEPGRGTFSPIVEQVIRSAVREALSVVVEDSSAPLNAGFVPIEKLGNVENANAAIPIQK